MTKKWLVALLSAAAMTSSAGALAQGTMSGAYVGLDVGQADFGDEDDTAFKIFGGFQFHPNLAAEVGYSMLLDKGPVEVTALEVVAVGIFPLANQFSILGKLGLANVDVETPVGSEDKTELTYGIGVQYDFTRNLGGRVQWQRYDTDEEIDLFTIGVVWKF
jgi:OOP family OmpA-OmpF porin